MNGTKKFWEPSDAGRDTNRGSSIDRAPRGGGGGGGGGGDDAFDFGAKAGVAPKAQAAAAPAAGAEPGTPPLQKSSCSLGKLYFGICCLVLGIGIGRGTCNTAGNGSGNKACECIVNSNKTIVVGSIPSPQPTLAPTSSPSGQTLRSECHDRFKYSLVEKFVVHNSTWLEKKCVVHEMDPFMQYVASALRFESITSNQAVFLFLSMAVQFGRIPNVRKDNSSYSAVGITLWGLWMAYALLQYLVTFLAQLLGVFATFSLVTQYGQVFERMEDGLGVGTGAAVGAGFGAVLGFLPVLQYIVFLKCGWYDIDEGHEESKAEAPEHPVKSRGIYCCTSMALCSAIGAFYGFFTNAAFFSAVIPSLLFHPTFVAKNAALIIYAFVIFQGLAAAGFAVDVDRLTVKYAWIMVAPLASIGTLYLVFTASFVFSAFFFVPMSACLLLTLLALWGFLKLINRGSAASRIVTINETKLDLKYINPLKPLHGALWWLPDEWIFPIKESAGHGICLGNSPRPMTTMLRVVCTSLVLIALSPALVFGPWSAFHAYMGRSPAENMAYVASAYEHFFGVFDDAEFHWSYLINFHVNLSDLSFAESLSTLKSMPSMSKWASAPPTILLQGSEALAALNLILTVTKPILSIFAFVSYVVGMNDKSEKVGDVAVGLASLVAILKLKGEKRSLALKAKNISFKTNEVGNITELSAASELNSAQLKALKFDIGALESCPDLLKFDFRGDTGICGDIKGFIKCEKLKSFRIGNCRVTGSVYDLVNCNDLELFECGNKSAITFFSKEKYPDALPHCKFHRKELP